MRERGISTCGGGKGNGWVRVGRVLSLSILPRL